VQVSAPCQKAVPYAQANSVKATLSRPALASNAQH
jgi:hypothetical protein